MSGQPELEPRLFGDLTTKPLSPDPDAQRGRKRHRSLTKCDTSRAKFDNAEEEEASTLRGRPRRRSTSPISFASRNTSRASGVALSLSPTKKRLLRVVVLERRRSQSPSRSRSPGGRQKAPRRRQRTRSRSRSHDDASCWVPAQSPRLRQELLLKKANRPQRTA